MWYAYYCMEQAFADMFNVYVWVGVILVVHFFVVNHIVCLDYNRDVRQRTDLHRGPHEDIQARIVRGN